MQKKTILLNYCLNIILSFHLWGGARMSKIDLVYAELLQELENIIFSSKKWDVFTQLLSEYTFDSKIIVQGIATNPYECFGLQTYGFNKKTIDDYVNYHFHSSPWKNFMLQTNEGDILWTDQLMPVRELHKTEFYHDLLKVEGAADSSTGMNVLDSDGQFTTIAIHYDHKISDRVHKVSSTLLEHMKYDLRSALLLNRVVNRSNSLNDKRTKFFLDNIKLPCFIINESKAIIAVNDCFDVLIRDRNFFYICLLNKLHFIDIGNNNIFNEKFHKLQNNNIFSVLEDKNLVISQDNFRLDFTFIPMKYSNKIMDFNGIPSYLLNGNMFMVTLSILETSRSMDDLSKILISEFNLTKYEANIVNYLIDGFSLEDLSKKNNVSIHTIRTQIKSIFNKMPVKRQQDLIIYALKIKNNIPM